MIQKKEGKGQQRNEKQNRNKGKSNNKMEHINPIIKIISFNVNSLNILSDRCFRSDQKEKQIQQYDVHKKPTRNVMMNRG